MPVTLEDLSNQLVTTGKPVEGGCAYVSFSNTPSYPTDATTALGSDWVSLGELADDAWTLRKSITTNSFTGYHGKKLLDEVATEEYTAHFNFVEVNRPAVAKLRYGEGNVEESATDGSVSHITLKSGGLKARPIVVEELESSGYKRRTLLRTAMPTSFDDVPHQRGSLMQYGADFSLAEDPDDGAGDLWRAAPVTAGNGG